MRVFPLVLFILSFQFFTQFFVVSDLIVEAPVEISRPLEELLDSVALYLNIVAQTQLVIVQMFVARQPNLIAFQPNTVQSIGQTLVLVFVQTPIVTRQESFRSLEFLMAISLLLGRKHRVISLEANDGSNRDSSLELPVRLLNFWLQLFLDFLNLLGTDVLLQFLLLLGPHMPLRI